MRLFLPTKAQRGGQLSRNKRCGVTDEKHIAEAESSI